MLFYWSTVSILRLKRMRFISILSWSTFLKQFTEFWNIIIGWVSTCQWSMYNYIPIRWAWLLSRCEMWSTFLTSRSFYWSYISFRYHWFKWKHSFLVYRFVVHSITYTMLLVFVIATSSPRIYWWVSLQFFSLIMVLVHIDFTVCWLMFPLAFGMSLF